MMRSTDIYANIGLSADIENASSHRLIQLLFDKSLKYIIFAKNNILDNDMQMRNKNIAKANDIIAHLKFCLNFKSHQAQELSTLLQRNYDVVEKCLFNTLLKNDITYLDIADQVITNIKTGWDGIAESVEKSI